MIIPSKFSGYQAGIRIYPGGKGGGAPDPAIGEALGKQADTADRLADFVLQSYEDNKPMLQELQRLNADVIKQQMGMAAKAEERADDAYGFYKNVGRPVVQQALNDAKQWDSEENRDAARGRATADVQQAVSMQQQQLGRNLARMGINPNSGRMMALQNQNAMMGAAMQAGAANNADENRRVQGVQMRQQASNIAQGMPATSMGFSGQAGGFGSSAAGVGGNNLQQGMSTQNQAIQGMGAVGQMYGNNAAGYQNQWNAQTQAASESAAGWGQLAGIGLSAMKFADGGKVGETTKNLRGEGGKISGPGTGTSDEVKAMNRDTGQPILLSNGEYIVPASVVKAKGVEFFDRLKEKYHTPVNQPVNLRSAA